jgi:RES domain-containing protein
VRLHRIALATYSANAADAFSGRGGLYGKGRWHTQGRLIVYVSQNTSLAMAEGLVHIQRSNNIEPFNRWEIDVPDASIAAAPVLPAEWRTNVALTQAYGDAWLASRSSVGHFVPSAIVPNEMNCLINPAHPQFGIAWVVSGPHPFAFDSRLTRPWGGPLG